ncbi:hypothetical protein [Phenylobacterium sp.]|uniref:hypothetical protein n=1 Tax=Phenylobacterium sp. TaxID=1871053 RepID=UPI003569A2A9
MDLIERYVAAVGRQLPEKQAADIENELRDVLLSRQEEQEARLGRPMTRSEMEALLFEFGHPLTVAGRYRRTQHLIGPEVFPFWWAAVKVMLSIVAGVYVVLIIVGVLTDQTPSQFNRAVPSIWYVAVYLFGLITLVCMGIERFGKTQVLQRWKPSHLPPAGGKQRSRFELGAEIGADVVFIAWWSGLIHFADLIPYPDFLRIDMAPVWTVWHWPILSYYVVEMIANLVAIARPGWIRGNAAILAVRYLVGIAILIQVVRAGHWLTVSSPAIPPHALAIVQTNVDLGMHIGLGLAIAGMSLRIALEWWRLRRRLRAQLAA